MKNLFTSKDLKLVDLSQKIVPPGTPTRPFRVERNYLHDRTWKHEIYTHSHVGTHIESPAHFFENGKDLEQFSLEAFCGRAWFCDYFDVSETHDEVTTDLLEIQLGEKVEKGDIVIGRNCDKENLQKVKQTGNRELLPSFSPEAGIWLRDRGVKMVGIDAHFHLGKNVEKTREFHQILMAQDVLLIEGLDNLDQITTTPFVFLAFPYRVEGIDSSFARAVAFLER